MAAFMSVSVVCPNRKKQIVKVSPNTSILYVLEEACKKQGFNSDEYDLKHSNKVVDLSLSLRFANIPNNACLEMCPAVHGHRSKSQVTVGLQLEDGRRLLHDFDCFTSLAEIINYWKEESGEEDLKGELKEGEPVCVYMRKEVNGEKALSETTLQSLGLIGGNAMIRLLYRTKEVLGKQAHVEAIIRPAKQEHVEWGTSLPNTSVNDWGKHEEITWDAPTSNQSKTTDNYWRTTGENTTKWLIDEEKQSENTITSPASVSRPVDNWTNADDSQRYEFENENISDAPCQENTENEDIEMTEDNREDKIVYLGERDAVLFNLNSIPHVIHADLPDEFFDLTIDDAKVLLCDIQRQRKNMEDQPLELASHKEARKKEELQKYQQTVIRVHFPDRLVLQAKFTPLETVSSVASFVKKFLQDPSENFHLYTTPPKAILDLDDNLFSANLVPAANVYFGSEFIRDVYLKADVLQQESTLGAASQAAAKLRNTDKINGRPTKRCSKSDVSLSPDIGGRPVKRSSDLDLPSTSSTVPRPKTAGSGVPKWFKLGSK